MAVILSNCDGAFALFGIKSRYQGVFFEHKGKTIKTINRFDTPKQTGPIVNDFWRVSCERGKMVEKCWFGFRYPVFFYELENGAADVILDCKNLFDNRVWGRNYKLERVGETLLIHFKKTNDLRESKSEGEYEFWLAAHGANFKLIEKWEEEQFTFDTNRNSPPHSRHVFRAFNTSGSFAFAYGENKSDASRRAKELWDAKKKLEVQASKNTAILLSKIHLKNMKLKLAAKACTYSLQALRAKQGIIAGFPWFTQRWARDELISVNAVRSNKCLTKSILFSWLEKLKPKGKLPATLDANTADSGWLFLRFESVLETLTKKEKEVLLDKLEYYIKELESNLVDGLVNSGSKETWMDSLDRLGARIEIQALTLASLRLYSKLKEKHPLEAKLKRKVKQLFFQQGYLKDSPCDSTIRPNVFIAAYAYPQLLSKSDWEQCFDFILPKLWLRWGGLSTIDKFDERFEKNHSGEVSTSYHNGDSWFWINNLAALVLARVNRRKYRKYIDAIASASTDEILNSGALYYHAEVSSASNLESRGCLAQAWSAAMYLEFVLEVFK